MLIVGLILLLLGVLAVVAAVFVSEPGTGGEILGIEVSTLESFLAGLAASVAILVGLSLMQRGARRGLAHRRERKQLGRRNEQLVQQQVARDERTVPVVDKRDETSAPVVDERDEKTAPVVDKRDEDERPA